MTQGRKKVEVGTLLLDNDKSSGIVNYKLSFVLKLSGLNGIIRIRDYRII